MRPKPSFLRDLRDRWRRVYRQYVTNRLENAYVRWRFGRRPSRRFLEEVQQILDLPGTIASQYKHGRDARLTIAVQGRPFSIFCMHDYDFESPIDWPEMPADFYLQFAPERGRARADMGAKDVPKTSVDDFNRTYGVFRPSCHAFCETLKPDILHLLLEYKRLSLEITSSPYGYFANQKRVTAEPYLYTRKWSTFIVMGSQRFTPQCCAQDFRDFVTFRTQLQALIKGA